METTTKELEQELVLQKNRERLDKIKRVIKAKLFKEDGEMDEGNVPDELNYLLRPVEPTYNYYQHPEDVRYEYANLMVDLLTLLAIPEVQEIGRKNHLIRSETSIRISALHRFFECLDHKPVFEYLNYHWCDFINSDDERSISILEKQYLYPQT